MNIEWLAAWPQVGDAPEYLWQGENCAYDGQCFNTLRPIISMLWFSLPHRLGLPSTAILLLHALLLLCSIGLSAHLMIRIAGKSARRFRLQQVFAVIGSASIHAAFLWPTFFYSLTDTPAALLILCAIFLLLILQIGNAKFRGVGYFFIGLVLGCAEGLRIFYLYPLLAFLALYLSISLMKKIRDRKKWYLLSALLPILLQNYATFLYSGEVAHMPTSSDMQFWSNMHRNSTYTGYDTLIPEEGYPWFKAPCVIHKGIWPSWQEKNWQQFSCLIAGRMYFLLGSYSPHTYFERDDIALGITTLIGNPEIKDSANWNNPYSQNNWKIQAAATPGDNLWGTNISIHLPEGPVTFGFTAQSDEKSTQLKASITNEAGNILSEKWIVLTENPKRHFLHANINTAGDYFLTIGAEKAHPAPFVFQIGDFRLTPSAAEEDAPVAPEKVRYWSLIFMAFNTVALLLFILATLKKAQTDPEWIAITALPLLILAQATIVIPEQRFIIFSEIFLWLVAATLLMHILITPRHTDALHNK